MFAPEFEINLVKHESQECSVLKTSESILLPPRYKVVAMAHFNLRSWPEFELVGFIEPNLDLGNIGLLIPCSVLRIGQSVAVVLSNLGEKTVHPLLGSTVGEICSIELLSDQQLVNWLHSEMQSVLLPERLQPLLTNINESLSAGQKNKIQELLVKHQDCFVGLLEKRLKSLVQIWNWCYKNLNRAGLRLKPSKCGLFQDKIQFWTMWSKRVQI